MLWKSHINILQNLAGVYELEKSIDRLYGKRKWKYLNQSECYLRGEESTTEVGSAHYEHFEIIPNTDHCSVIMRVPNSLSQATYSTLFEHILLVGSTWEL